MPKAVPLNKPVTTIGRAPDNDIVLTYDTEVSRYHAEVRREGATLVLYDRNSRNGTFVNNAQVTSHTLREGDQVRVGNSALYLQGGSLWVPDEAVIGAAAAGPIPVLPLVLGIAGLLILLGAAVLFGWSRREPPLQTVVAVAGGANTSGSGTIVDSRGLILTANSVVGGASAPLVGLITRPEVPPATWFETRVVVADANLDLAVLVISNQVSGEPVTGPLDLPALTLGDSDGLVEGERLNVIGFPAVPLPLTSSFPEIVRVQDAVVGRFQIWPGGTRQWVELDEDIGNPGYKGGAVLNERDELVGVPLLPDPTAPRQVQPINLALGMIRQARVTLGW
jgi:S1-C subfamily serine protease